DLADEGDLVRVLARHRSEHAEGRGDRVTTALDRQLDDLLAVEVSGVCRKRGTGGVLDPLVDREDGEIAGAGQAAVVEQRLEAAQHARRAVAGRENSGHEVRARKVQLRLRD